MSRFQLRTTAHRLETTFAGRCAREFIALQGFDRAVVLASQALTALIPLLLLVSAAAPAGHGDGVSRALVTRFHLEGDAAASVEQLFAHSGSGAVGVFSGFLLLFSGVSLTRRMQRMYRQARRLGSPRRAGPGVHPRLGPSGLARGRRAAHVARAPLRAPA